MIGGGAKIGLIEQIWQIKQIGRIIVIRVRSNSSRGNPYGCGAGNGGYKADATMTGTE